MIRRAYIIAMMALGLTAGAVHSAPAFGKFVSSAQSFRYYYRDLQKSGSELSPIQRFVFSLVMANPTTPRAKAPEAQCSVQEHQT